VELEVDCCDVERRERERCVRHVNNQIRNARFELGQRRAEHERPVTDLAYYQIDVKYFLQIKKYKLLKLQNTKNKKIKNANSVNDGLN
jgi:hypothetical protein